MCQDRARVVKRVRWDPLPPRALAVGIASLVAPCASRPACLPAHRSYLERHRPLPKYVPGQAPAAVQQVAERAARYTAQGELFCHKLSFASHHRRIRMSYLCCAVPSCPPLQSCWTCCTPSPLLPWCGCALASGTAKEATSSCCRWAAARLPRIAACLLALYRLMQCDGSRGYLCCSNLPGMPIGCRVP